MNKLKILFLSALICLCAMSCQKNDKNQDPQNQQTQESPKLEKTWAGTESTFKVYKDNKLVDLSSLATSMPQYANQINLITSLSFSQIVFQSNGKYQITAKLEGKDDRIVEGKWNYTEMSDNKKIDIHMNLDEVYGPIDVIQEKDVNVTFTFDINELTVTNLALAGSGKVIVQYVPYEVKLTFKGTAK